ncbi:hypothetical protein CVT24_008035 [Panaeolus cyanescens]|uniref:DUF1917-domain-containing protein n=1 Tax=Panaeolus cyanescens TaxID=181874 RepID=A0A409YQZ7_9AGAR|nr:hypothetical protein CVT24_008035 [Panaeolus cyanescens]
MDAKIPIDAIIIGSVAPNLSTCDDRRTSVTSDTDSDHILTPSSPTAQQKYRAPHRRVARTMQNIFFHGIDANVTKANIRQFLEQFPPSRTPLAQDYFICVTRFKDPYHRLGLKESNLKALQESFDSLVEAENVTAESIQQISKEHNVVSGKWVLFVPEYKVDAMWAKVVDLVCLYRKAQCANLRNTPQIHGGQQAWRQSAICVWVEDFTDKKSVVELRKYLRLIGVQEEIAFKPDAYSYLGIYSHNIWNVRPGIVYI